MDGVAVVNLVQYGIVRDPFLYGGAGEVIGSEVPVLRGELKCGRW